MRTNKTKTGFTLIETLLVLVLLTSALGLSMLFYQSSQVRADINGQAAILVSDLRLAQSNTETGKVQAFNAVHLENNAYTLFDGQVFDPDDPSNFDHQMPQSINIGDILLNGGGNDIIFIGPHGETENFGSFNLISANRTITIYINSLGRIDY